MQKKDITKELTERGVKFSNAMPLPKLIEKLNEARAAAGESPLDPASITTTPPPGTTGEQGNAGATKPPENEGGENTAPEKKIITTPPQQPLSPKINKPLPPKDPSEELAKIEMVLNVKHGTPETNAERYEKGKTYEVDLETADLFKTNGWAK